MKITKIKEITEIIVIIEITEITKIIEITEIVNKTDDQEEASKRIWKTVAKWCQTESWSPQNKNFKANTL